MAESLQEVHPSFSRLDNSPSPPTKDTTPPPNLFDEEDEVIMPMPSPRSATVSPAKRCHDSQDNKEDAQGEIGSSPMTTPQTPLPPPRVLRRRTALQDHPYGVDKYKYRMLKSGRRPTDTEVEDGFLSTQLERHRKSDMKQSFKRKSVTKKKAKRNGCHEAADNTSESSHTEEWRSSLFISGSNHNVNEHIFENTVLQTKFHELAGATLPIYLKQTTLTQLFDEINAKWRFKLGDREVTYCILRFPWLEDDANIFLTPDNEDGLKMLIEEVGRAPRGDEMENCKVDVKICTG